MLTGRVPMAQPPGKDTFAFPNLPSSEPSTITPALMVFTKEYGAIVLNSLFLLCIKISLFLKLIFILEPICFNNSDIVITSRTSGIFFICIFLSLNIEAAKIGRAAFFEPDIFTTPDKLFLPFTTNFCIN